MIRTPPHLPAHREPRLFRSPTNGIGSLRPILVFVCKVVAATHDTCDPVLNHHRETCCYTLLFSSESHRLFRHAESHTQTGQRGPGQERPKSIQLCSIRRLSLIFQFVLRDRSNTLWPLAQVDRHWRESAFSIPSPLLDLKIDGRWKFAKYGVLYYPYPLDLTCHPASALLLSGSPSLLQISISSEYLHLSSLCPLALLELGDGGGLNQPLSDLAAARGKVSHAPRPPALLVMKGE